MHVVTAGCITGFEARLLPSDLLPQFKSLATIFPPKSETKHHFKDFRMEREGSHLTTDYFSQPEISDHLYIYLHLLTSLPLHNYKSPQLLFFARWNKPGLLASALHVPLSSD